MGWDAFAMKDGKDLDRTDPESGFLPLDATLEQAFGAASDRVKALTGTVDGFLSNGCLDCSDCGNAIEQATEIEAWGDDLPPADVTIALRSADWPKSTESAWAVESARAFLEVCSAHGLGVRFTW